MGPEPIEGCDVPGTHIWGWMSPDELNWLMDKASQMDSVVEVGSLHGRSAFALLTACPGTVYAIDPWNDEGNHSYGSFVGSCGHFSNLVPVKGYSPEVIEAYNLPDVDMVFIDGDHKEASVRADIEGWLPKTKKLICGHDYVSAEPGINPGFPDVAITVDKIFGNRVRVGKNTAIWYVEL